MKTTMLVSLALAVIALPWTGCGSASRQDGEAEKQRRYESSPAVKRKQREAARKAIEGTTKAIENFRLPDGDEIRPNAEQEGWLTREQVRERTGWSNQQIDLLAREGRLRPGGRQEQGRLSVPVYNPDEVDRLHREIQSKEKDR